MAMESGDEDISTTVVLFFIVAISITLYISFLETNKRRHQRARSRVSSGKDIFESICEWAYRKMETGFSSGTEKKLESSSSSERNPTGTALPRRRSRNQKRNPNL
jgi:hypothetical protein